MRSAPAALRRVELAGARAATHAPRFAAWRRARLEDVRRLPPALLVGGAFAGGAAFGRLVGVRRLLALAAFARSAPVLQFVAALRPREHADGG